MNGAFMKTALFLALLVGMPGRRSSTNASLAMNLKSAILLGLLMIGSPLLSRSSSASEAHPALPPVTEEIRLAVVGEGEADKFAESLTAELSHIDKLVLLERKEIARVFEEHKLAQLIQSKNYREIGKILKADGLIILTPVKIEKQAAFSTRLVAVNPGVVLQDVLVPASDDELLRGCKTIALRFAPFFKKLDVSREKAVPISILNLRSEVGGSGSVELERNLTTLLASRLTQERDIFVLERLKMDSLSWEKDLEAERKREFWNGSYLLDGSIVLSSVSDAQISIRARLRPPHGGKEVEIKVFGSRSKLATLVNDLASQIVKSIGRQSEAPSWKPMDEAKEYVDEAIWAHNNDLTDVALSAAEASWALGGRSPILSAMRIQLHAVKSDSKEMSSNERLEHLSTALECNRVFIESGEHEKLGNNGRTSYWKFSSRIAGDVVLGATLRMFQEDPSSIRNPGMAAEFRKLVRQNLELSLGVRRIQAHLYGTLIDLAPFCSETPEALLVFYRQLFAKRRPDFCGSAMTYLRAELMSKGQEILTSRFKDQSGRMRALWEAFAVELAEDPRTAVDGLMLQLGLEQKASLREGLFLKVLAGMWDHREILLRDELVGVYLEPLNELPEKKLIFEHGFAARLLGEILAKGAKHDPVAFDILWQPGAFSDQEANGIEAAFEAYRQRVLPVAPIESQAILEKKLASNQAALLERFPKLQNRANDIPPVNALLIKRFWHPSFTPETSDRTFHIFDSTVLKNKAWLLASWLNLKGTCGVYCVDLSSFESTFIESPTGPQPYQIKVTPEHLIVTDGYNLAFKESTVNRLYCFDDKSRQWESSILPRYRHEGFNLVGNEVYLDCYNRENELETGGIAKCDLDGQHVRILANSRRRPPLNQFDDRGGYRAKSIFQGIGGHAWALIGGRCYAIREEAGSWEDQIPQAPGELFAANAYGQIHLIYSRRWHFFAIRPGSTTLETLLLPPVAATSGIFPPAATEWDTPDDWNTGADGFGPANNGLNEVVAAYDGKDLYILQQNAGKTPVAYRLLWYRMNGGRKPWIIPLKFKRQTDVGSLEKSSKEDRSKWAIAHPEREREIRLGLACSQGGVLITSRMTGFWFIPTEDLRKWADHQKDARSASHSFKNIAQEGPEKK